MTGEPVDLVLAESVSARPGEGVVSAFGFGRSSGLVEGVFGALGHEVRRISPQSWKKKVGIPSGLSRTEGKNEARRIAGRLWPEMAGKFGRVKDADRADACLIALAGLLA